MLNTFAELQLNVIFLLSIYNLAVYYIAQPTQHTYPVVLYCTTSTAHVPSCIILHNQHNTRTQLYYMAQPAQHTLPCRCIILHNQHSTRTQLYYIAQPTQHTYTVVLYGTISTAHVPMQLYYIAQPAQHTYTVVILLHNQHSTPTQLFYIAQPTQHTYPVVLYCTTNTAHVLFVSYCTTSTAHVPVVLYCTTNTAHVLNCFILHNQHSTPTQLYYIAQPAQHTYPVVLYCTTNTAHVLSCFILHNQHSTRTQLFYFAQPTQHTYPVVRGSSSPGVQTPSRTNNPIIPHIVVSVMRVPSLAHVEPVTLIASVVWNKIQNYFYIWKQKFEFRSYVHYIYPDNSILKMY